MKTITEAKIKTSLPKNLDLDWEDHFFKAGKRHLKLCSIEFPTSFSIDLNINDWLTNQFFIITVKIIIANFYFLSVKGFKISEYEWKNLLLVTVI